MTRELSIGSDLTPLEHALLAAICEGHSADRVALKAQLSSATLLRRQNTGAGFYTSFAVERASSTAIGSMRHIDGPSFELDGLEHGMGCILWLKEGYVDCLEGYSYDESTTGIVLETTNFKILQS